MEINITNSFFNLSGPQPHTVIMITVGIGFKFELNLILERLFVFACFVRDAEESTQQQQQMW